MTTKTTLRQIRTTISNEIDKKQSDKSDKNHYRTCGLYFALGVIDAHLIGD